VSDGGAAKTRVGDVSTIIRGVTYGKKDASAQPGEGRIALLRSGNVRDEIELNDLVYVPRELVRPEQELRPGDIVVSSSNSVDLVGKSAQVRESIDATFGAFCMIVRPGEGVLPRYLGLVLRSPDFLTAMRRAAGATNNIANIRKGHVDDFEFLLPSEAAQRRIVTEYEMRRGELLAGIASIREAAELLVTLEGRIIDEAIALAAGGAETARLGDAVEKLTSGSRDWKPYCFERRTSPE
jgi:type I restriction enzyme, S subunit